MNKKLLVLLACIFGIAHSDVQAQVFIDNNFGIDGKVVSSPDGSEMTPGRSMALQADGKILMFGNRNDLDFVVARYNSNGSPDMTFGVNGWTSTAFAVRDTTANSIAVQSDGKIVAGGTTYALGSNGSLVAEFVIVRYNSNGSLDTTFDSDGKATVSFNPEIIGSGIENLTSLKIAPDGKIVAAGYVALFPDVGKFAIARLNADGSLDTSFGTNGRVVDSINAYKVLNDMSVMTDGSIVVVGGISEAAGGSRIAQKYNVSGELVWTYTGFESGSVLSKLNGVAFQPDGKIIVSGNRQGRVAVIRLNTDGSVDGSFNNPLTFPDGEAISVAVQADGKIVANFSSSAYSSSFSLVRLNQDGTPDTSFGNRGLLNYDLTAGQDEGRKVIIQPDGKILVGGSTILSNPTRKYFSMARFNASGTANSRRQFDYDGDGKADISVYRPSNGVWYLNQSTNGFLGIQFGISTDRIVPADYDGDGKTDVAIYRDGVWWILQSATNSVKILQFGIAEDKPQVGDYDGDGKADIAVWRPSNGVWYVLRSSDNGFYGFQFGIATEDVPQAADYDGDGRTDIAIFRSSYGIWYVQKSLGGYLIQPFGASGDKPVAADYDGDGRTDLAVWRAATREWFVLASSNNQPTVRLYGVQGDIPVPADYDGDGKADIAFFRPSNGIWYRLLSNQGADSQFLFGLQNDLPTPNAYNP